MGVSTNSFSKKISNFFFFLKTAGRSLKNFWRLTFGVWRLTFSVWSLAFEDVDFLPIPARMYRDHNLAIISKAYVPSTQKIFPGASSRISAYVKRLSYSAEKYAIWRHRIDLIKITNNVNLNMNCHIIVLSQLCEKL